MVSIDHRSKMAMGWFTCRGSIDDDEDGLPVGGVSVEDGEEDADDDECGEDAAPDGALQHGHELEDGVLELRLNNGDSSWRETRTLR